MFIFDNKQSMQKKNIILHHVMCWKLSIDALIFHSDFLIFFHIGRILDISIVIDWFYRLNWMFIANNISHIFDNMDACISLFFLFIIHSILLPLSGCYFLNRFDLLIWKRYDAWSLVSYLNALSGYIHSGGHRYSLMAR